MSLMSSTSTVVGDGIMDLLPLLDDDAVLSILCSLPGSPSAQARFLNNAGRTSTPPARALEDCRQNPRGEEHMRRCHAELTRFATRIRRSSPSALTRSAPSLPATLELDLDGPGRRRLRDLSASRPLVEPPQAAAAVDGAAQLDHQLAPGWRRRPPPPARAMH